MKNKIKLFVMDVDGTLTDGKIYMSSSGEAFKAFNIKDGYAIHDILPALNVTPVIITARTSEILARRCNELGIKYCFQGCSDKLGKLRELVEQFKIHINENGKYNEIAYIGDDIPDLMCMRICGIVGCPIDAVEKVKAEANFISTKKGGEGAVREFVEWIFN